MGVEHSVPVAGGQVDIPVDDLLTYVFVPVGTSVSVAQQWWTTTRNLLAGQLVTNESGTTAKYINDGSFATNQQDDDPTVYVDKSVPGKLSAVTNQAAVGFALLTVGPAWQTAGCSLVSFTIDVDGKQIYHFSAHPPCRIRFRPHQ